MDDVKIEIKIPGMCSYRAVGELKYICYDDTTCTLFEAREALQKILVSILGNLDKTVEVYKTKDL